MSTSSRITKKAPHLSRRGEAMPASPIRHLAPLAVAAAERGVRVFRLNIGQPDVATAEPFLNAYKSFAEPVIAYAPSDGLRTYRDALVTYYASFGVIINADDIIVTTGGSEALMMALAAVADPGDEVLFFEPCYPNYIGFSRWLGVEPRFVTTRREAGYHLPDRATIEKAIGKKTRALVICNPGNPTGTVHTREEVERLADIARERGLFLISDEVYRELVFDVDVPTPVLSLPDLEDYAIQVDSTSKRYSACGARIGWVVTRNAAVRSAMLRMGQARLSAPTLGQLAGQAAVSLPPAYQAKVNAEYKARRDLLLRRLEKMKGVELSKPDGAFYVMVTLPVKDADAFAAWLLNEFDHAGETVLLAPGPGFYGTPGLGRREVRIAYVLERPDLDRAMDALEHALEVYPDRID